MAHSLVLSLTVTFAACGSEMDGSFPSTDATGSVDGLATDATDNVPSDGDAATTTDALPGGDTSQSDGSNVDDTDDPDVEPTLVRIVNPVSGATVEGPIVVRLEPVGRIEREVDDVSVKVNGHTVFSDKKLPTEFVLDTREHGTAAYDIVATAQDGFETGSHKIRVQPTNPPMSFVEVTPRDRVLKKGEVVSLTVKINGPPEVKLTADFSALDSGYTPGSEQVFALGSGTWALTYIITDGDTVADGTYVIPVKASVADWEIGYTQLSLSLHNAPIVPITVQGAIFVDDKLPQPSPGFGGAKPTLTLSNTTILTGGSSSVNVDFASAPAPQDIVGVVIGLEANTGYWQIPVDMTKPNAVTKIDASFVLRAYRSFETVPDRLPLRVALRDVRGNISPYAAKLMEVIEVGTGDVQVSLSWDTDTDVDLHVRSPGDPPHHIGPCEIYYGNTSCDDGGELDLDSNPGCYLDHVRNENVYWADNPPSGTYRVYVDFYEDCSNVGANYAVTVTYCGKSDVFEGRFNAGSDDSGGAFSGRFITTFDPGACARTARGKVRYQDRTFDKTGFGAYSWQTLEGAHVELRHIQTGAVIGSGTTDRNGNYAIGFPATGVPGFIVAVQARTDPAEGLRDIEVLDHPKFKKLYEVTSSPIIIFPDTEDIVQDVDITTELKAGAFNVFDVLRHAYDGVRLQNGRELGHLRAFWATGADTTDTIFCSQFLYDNGVCTEVNTVSVQGKDSDRDEYDDMVITKEFFKFVLAAFSRDSHPGGTADGRRTDARLAWTEGLAAWFAADVSRSRYFVNSRPQGVTIVDDLEAMPSPFALGLDSESELSPYLVSALLWDLSDGANEPWDQLAGDRNGVYDTLFSYLPSGSFVDRGPTGVDLTDFLDGWVCRGWGGGAALPALVTDHYHHDYDFQGPATCDTP
ncbi:MAG: hypothetical protein U1F43_02760 [Myxococcota bacterium]